MSVLLKLLAEDTEDLGVFAACLQDSLLSVGAMTYLPQEQRFAMVVQRFRWEVVERACERVECGVRIDGVRHVRSRGFDRRDPERLLELLTITLEGAVLRLHFAGGVDIELTVGPWLCTLEDRGAPWPASAKPCHALEDE